MVKYDNIDKLKCKSSGETIDCALYTTAVHMRERYLSLKDYDPIADDPPITEITGIKRFKFNDPVLIDGDSGDFNIYYPGTSCYLKEEEGYKDLTCNSMDLTKEEIDTLETVNKLAEILNVDNLGLIQDDIEKLMKEYNRIVDTYIYKEIMSGN